MYDPKITGERLKSLRLAHDIKQEEIALGIGVGQSTVSAQERGQSVPTTQAIFWFARRYSVSADYLLGLTDAPLYDAVPIAEAQTIVPESDFASLEKIKAYIDALVEETVNKAVDRKFQK